MKDSFSVLSHSDAELGPLKPPNRAEQAEVPTSRALPQLAKAFETFPASCLLTCVTKMTCAQCAAVTAAAAVARTCDPTGDLQSERNVTASRSANGTVLASGCSLRALDQQRNRCLLSAFPLDGAVLMGLQAM